MMLVTMMLILVYADDIDGDDHDDDDDDDDADHADGWIYS